MNPPRSRALAQRLALLAALVAAGAGGYAVRALTTGGAAASTASSAGSASATTAPAAVSTVSTVAGRSVVTLDAAVQAASGLRTLTLPPAQDRHETLAYAEVLALPPLIDLRGRHTAALAEQVASAAAAQAASAEETRSGALYRDGQNVSLQVFQAAQANARALRARADAAARAVDGLGAEARSRFGDTLARWLLDPEGAAWQRLLRQHEVLLRVTLPPGARGPAPPRIEIDRGGGQRVAARFVAPAAQGDPSVPGAVAVYRATGPIVAGTRLDAWLAPPAPAAGSAASASGAVVPPAAIVWYGGQPWAYVQGAAGQFTRVAVPAGGATEGGYFVVSPLLAAGSRVVVEGAQLLLSEELKPRAAGAACKDPECD